MNYIIKYYDKALKQTLLHLLARANFSTFSLERWAFKWARRCFNCSDRDDFKCGKPMFTRAVNSGSLTFSSKI